MGAESDLSDNTEKPLCLKAQSDRLWRMLGYLRPVWPILLFAALLLFLKIFCEVAALYYLSPAVTELTGLASRPLPPSRGFVHFLFFEKSTEALRQVLGWMVLYQAALGVLSYLKAVWDSRLSMHAVFFLRSAVFDQLQRAHFTFHDQRTSGRLIHCALSDLQAVRTFLNMSLLSTLDIVLTVGAYLFLLTWQSPLLSLAALLPIPFWLYLISKFSREAQSRYHRQQKAGEKLIAAFAENIAGVHVIRSFGTEEDEIKKYKALNQSFLGHLLSMVQLQQYLPPSLKLMTVGSHIILFGISGLLVAKGQLEIGSLVLLGSAMSSLLSKLQQVNAIADAYQKAIVSSGRLFEILDTPSPHASLLPREEFPKGPGEIEFRNVTFGYDPNQNVLHDVSANVAGGKLTAIVGPTGSGKSTLVSLIARFYDPCSGHLFLDGCEIRSLNLSDLRHAVGYVFQETFLFQDTIRNNILFGKSDVDEAMLRKACHVAHADEFIESLPEGYDALLGEGGIQLSGGQRQRLALARALLYDPRILILDDATASLDAETDHAVHSKLPSHVAGRTVLVIAHKLSTVCRADWVLVMREGRIVDRGTHQALMTNCKYYSDLVEGQLALETDFTFSEDMPLPKAGALRAR